MIRVQPHSAYREHGERCLTVDGALCTIECKYGSTFVSIQIEPRSEAQSRYSRRVMTAENQAG